MAKKRRSTRRSIRRKVARTSSIIKGTRLSAAERNPVGFPSEIRTRKNLKYVVVPIEAVRGVSPKRLQDQVRLAQVDNDLIKSLEEMVTAAKRAKRGALSTEAELALSAAAW